MIRPTVLSIEAIGLGLILALSAPARAGGLDPCVTDELCREHEDLGINYSVQKDYASALVEFQTAYSRAPIPRLLINIGRSLFRLGQPKDALRYYERFLRAEPNPAPEITLKIQQYIAEAKAAIEAVPRVTELSSRRSAPNLPGPPKENKEVVFSSPPLHLAETKKPAIIDRSARGFPIGAGVLLGVGVVGLAAGIGLGTRALGLSSEVVNNYGPFNDGLYAQGQTFNQAAIALDVIGGAALAAGGIWLGVWLSRRQTTTARADSLHSLLATQGSW